MVLTPRTKHFQNPHQELNQEEQKSKQNQFPLLLQKTEFSSAKVYVFRDTFILCKDPTLFSSLLSPSSWGKKKEISPSPFTLKPS